MAGDLTNENYFSKENEHDYMSYSQFKDFLECEAMALAIAEGRYEKPTSNALLQGAYVDAYFSGEAEQFKEANPSIFKKDGSLKAEFEVCERVIKAIEDDTYFKEEFFSGKPQVVLTGEIEGVPFKGKIDMLYDDKIVDMKCMASIDPIWDEEEHRKAPFYAYYKYHIQAAIYRELVRQKTGKTLPYYLAVATKEREVGKYSFHFSDDVLDKALELVKALAPRFQAIKNHEIEPNECGKCDYYKSVHKHTIFDTIEITMDNM